MFNLYSSVDGLSSEHIKFKYLWNMKRLGSCHTLDLVSKENRQILDWTENKIYYKTTIIKWRGSSVG